MAPKSSAQLSLKQKLKRLFKPQSKVIQESVDDLKAHVDDLKAHIDDLQAQFGQFISIISLKQELPAIPSKALQIRVAGTFHPVFFEIGKSIFYEIADLLKCHGQNIFDSNSILDFGCGCGRVLIPMSHLIDPKRISGTDIDEEAIRWLKRNYPYFNDLDANKALPPTKYSDSAFEIIYGVSVFTHLPEDMQHAWLKELCRILKPGGYGIFTTHGQNYFRHVKGSAYEELMSKGFYYSNFGRTDGLPEFYQTSFHTSEYIRREWNRYFEVLEIREPRSSGHDVVLVRKRK